MAVGSVIPNVTTVVPNDWHSLMRFSRDVQKYLSALAKSDRDYYMSDLYITSTTALRLLATDASQKVVSTDLASWVTGTSNEIEITDDGDGTITIGIVDPLIVAKGGTGAATLTDHGILLGSGTDAITPLGVATNGQLPIGSTGADPVLATLTGTANEVVVTNGAGSITLSVGDGLSDIGGLTPADSNFIVGDGANWTTESGNTARTSLGLGTGDSPTFTGLDLTGLTDGRIPYLGASGFTDTSVYYSSGSVGFGAVGDGERIYATRATYPVIRAVRTTASTNAGQAALDFVAHTSGDMVDGFGGGLTLSIADDADAINIAAGIYCERDGADNTSGMLLRTRNAGSWVDNMWLDPDGNVGINETAPAAKLEVNGDARFGNGGSNYAEFESDGTLHLNGDATVWNDFVVPVQVASRSTVPGTTAPNELAYKGGVVYEFIDGADRTCYFTIQLPHTYKEGTDIVFHIHWSIDTSGAGAGAENVEWDYSYSASSPTSDHSESWPAPTTGTQTVDVQSVTADDHVLSNIVTITGTNFKISEVIIMSLTRTGSTDSYGGHALLVSADVHHEIDTVGSRQITTK